MITGVSAVADSIRFCTFAAAFCIVSAFAGHASAQEATVVVLGDSNAQGYGVNPQQAFPSRLETMLRSSGRSVRVINAGVALDTFGKMLARVDSSVPSGTQLVVVQGGYNDLDQEVSPNVTLANLRAILSRLQTRHVKTVLCGFFYKNWDAIGRRLAAQYRSTFVPGRTCYDPNNTGPDGLHMSAAGHQIVASRLARVIGRMLPGRESFATVKRSNSAAAPVGRP